jgi:hypothetical protein
MIYPVTDPISTNIEMIMQKIIVVPSNILVVL